MKRAERRHMAQVLKTRAITKLKLWRGLEARGFTAREIGKAATDRQPCSCHMCRNPRTSKLSGSLRERLTMQERRALLDG